MTYTDSKTDDSGDARRGLASVSLLLDRAEIKALVSVYSRVQVVEALRTVLEEARQAVTAGADVPAADELISRVSTQLRREEQECLRPVVNATGILLHTGLGRAVLPRNAVDALAGLDRCCNLQIDLESGARGKRNYMTERLLCRLTGAEAAMVVNNNAAATLLVLSALCRDREVIVSRGQLIEIGGSYRLPDCVHQSGARLVEVGTTNKTHVRDYAQALNENTGALLHVNPSNYRVVGFTKTVSIEDLVALKAERPVLVIDDLGCGALLDLQQFGLPHEPTVQESVAAGADLVCFSGDKLIGGPQAGIIVGRADLIRKIKQHPLTRMLRVGKMTDMVLEHTLRLFLDPETLVRNNPTLRMLTTPLDLLKERADKMKQRLDSEAPWLKTKAMEGESAMGGGALPGIPIPTWTLVVASGSHSAEALSRLLRKHEPPVIGHIVRDQVTLDMRTLLEGEDEIVVEALKSVRD